MLVKTENGRVFESTNLVAIQVGRNKESGTFNGTAILSCGIAEITIPVTHDGTEEFALERISYLFTQLDKISPTLSVEVEKPTEPELPVVLEVIDLTKATPKIRIDGFYSSCRIE